MGGDILESFKHVQIILSDQATNKQPNREPANKRWKATVSMIGMPKQALHMA